MFRRRRRGESSQVAEGATKGLKSVRKECIQAVFSKEVTRIWTDRWLPRC